MNKQGNFWLAALDWPLLLFIHPRKRLYYAFGLSVRHAVPPIFDQLPVIRKGSKCTHSFKTTLPRHVFFIFLNFKKLTPKLNFSTF